jgi:hypothetical protein
MRRRFGNVPWSLRTCSAYSEQPCWDARQAHATVTTDTSAQTVTYASTSRAYVPAAALIPSR